MNRPILSICIPTYNRHEYLARCLESVQIQTDASDELRQKIEIVISDNGSIDNTTEIVEKFQHNFSHFIYVRNQTNIGFDMNVYNVVSQATGKYCWYMGDDDMLINGSLEFMVDCLKDNKYDVVGILGLPFSSGDIYKHKQNFNKNTLVEIADYNEFYFKEYLQGGFSFMIFERSLWLSCVNADDYLKYWLYYENVAKMLVHTKKIMLHVPQPLIMTGQDCRWAENGTELFAFVYSNYLRQRLIDFGFDKKRLSKDLINNSKRVVIILLRAKGHGLKSDLTNFKLMYTNFTWRSSFYYVVASMIYFLPNSLIVLIRDLKKKFYS
ncbi:MAG: glycosyltransferase family 2 protein [Candidatus Falkowbacteria bacterium]